MKDGPETAGVRTASSATNGSGTPNGDSRDKSRTIQLAEGSPTTLLAVGAEELTVGDNALPLGGTLTLLQGNGETTQKALSPDADDKGKDGKGDKVFVCGICNKCFGYRHVLQNHERTHTGEKPFECPECHKRFTRDHHLKTHIRLHTGEKPYQCSYCERHFAQVANLRRHLRTHTGERPYGCQICTSKFSDSNQLKSHMLIHKGEKPYQCVECLGRFRRRHHLNHHKCPKDKANMGKPRRGRRPRAYDQLPRSGDEDDPDPLRISENEGEEDTLDHNNHSSSETEHSLSTPNNNNNNNSQVHHAVVNNGRKTNHAIRILTPQQRELFLRDKVSMQTQAIDMRVSSDVHKVIVPRKVRVVEGVLDLSNSRSDSEIEPSDEGSHTNGDDEIVNGIHDHHQMVNGMHDHDPTVNGMHDHERVVNGIHNHDAMVNGIHEDDGMVNGMNGINGDDIVSNGLNGDSHHHYHYNNHQDLNNHVHHKQLRSFAIRRTDQPASVIISHRPTVLVGKKIVEPLNGRCSSNGLDDHHMQMNGNSMHFSSEEDDDSSRKNCLSPRSLPLTKKASIVTA